MPNSLLDFVMSLVRDPDAAAQYAADPTGAIADANLTDVTTADVNHLIPVVAESLSTTVPTLSGDAFGGDAASNVWTSGAATAAFDAFDDHLPQQVVHDPGGVITDLIAPAGGSVVDALPTDADVPALASVDDPGLGLDQSIVDDVPAFDGGAGPDWTTHLVGDHHLGTDGAGLDDLI